MTWQEYAILRGARQDMTDLELAAAVILAAAADCGDKNARAKLLAQCITIAIKANKERECKQ